MPSTLDILASELASALVPLRSGLAGQRNATYLLDVLGWEPPPSGVPQFPDLHLGDLLAKLATAQAAVVDVELHAGEDGFTVALDTRYAELAAAVAQTLSSLRGLAGTFAGWPANYLALTNIQNDFLPRLLNYLIVQSLMDRHPTLFGWLDLLGLVEAVHFDRDRPKFQTEHLRYALRFDRLGTLLGGPPALFAARFGWGTASFDFGGFLASLALLFQSLGGQSEWGEMSVEDESLLLGRAVPEATADPLPKLIVTLLLGPGTSEFGMLLAPLRPSAPGSADGGIAIGPFVSGTADTAFTLPGPFRLEIGGKLDLSAGALLMQRPNQPPAILTNLSADNPGRDPAGGLQLGLRYTRPGDRPISLLEIPGGSRLEVGQIGINFGGRPNGGKAELYVEMELSKAAFVLNAVPASALLTDILPPDAVRADLDLAIGWAGGRGAYLRGSAGLQVSFPINQSIGPAEFETVNVRLAPAGGGGIPIEVSGNISATLGPLRARVERIGLLVASTFPGSAGNLGPLNIELGFKFPSGIGIVIDAGLVRGGGFLAFDPVANRYSGVLQLKLKFIDIIAYAIYEKIPGGPVSFVAVMGVRFPAGIQLGFGFMLTGIGGLIGLNRRTNSDLLRERLASGAAGNTLFCEDPVRNAPTLLGDLAAFFPASEGGFLVGPTAQISWLFIVRFDLGIIIEFPGPARILILGTARAMIGPSEDMALLFLRMDILGEINFELALLAFDAHLVNSHVLGILKLTGGMAFRLHWGSNAYVVLTIGGFHPRFDPGPLRLPALARVGGSLDISVVVLDIWVRLEIYLAFTSNTLQAGARVEAGMQLGPISAKGFFIFDALVQFRPFYFEADFSAGFSVEVFDISLASVEVAGRISGPGPVVIQARASVRRLFIKVSASVTFRLGDDNADRPAPIPSLVRSLEPELSKVSNLQSAGEDRQVFFKPERAPAAGILLTPTGSLIWEQKRIPLETTVHRLEGVDLGGPHFLHLDPFPGWTTTSVTDWFNPGSFTHLDLKASQTLNNTTFQELPSGFRISGAQDVGAPAVVQIPTITISLFKRPERIKILDIKVSTYMNEALTMMLHERSTTPAVNPGETLVKVQPETFIIYNPEGKPVLTAQTPFQAFQIAREIPGGLAVPGEDIVVNL